MSGFRVAEELSGKNSPVKVIFLTAYADRSYVERAFEIGVKGYLLKGKMWTELPEAIREVLAGGVYRSPSSSTIKMRAGIQPSLSVGGNRERDRSRRPGPGAMSKRARSCRTRKWMS